MVVKKTKAPKRAAAKPVAPKTSAKVAETPVKPAIAASTKRISRVPAPPPKMTAVSDDTDTMAGPELKKQELIQKVVDRSGIKKKDAKPVIEAALAVLGEALAEGRELNLQPLGKLKLNRTKETANARIIIAKIRQSKGGPKPQNLDGDPLAAAAE